jgi:hypothetical protein
VISSSTVEGGGLLCRFELSFCVQYGFVVPRKSGRMVGFGSLRFFVETPSSKGLFPPNHESSHGTNESEFGRASSLVPVDGTDVSGVAV